jgi:hypothetical protein
MGDGDDKGHPYRAPEEVRADEESLAAAALFRRAARVRMISVFVALVLALLVAIPIYFGLRELQFAAADAYVPKLTGLVALGVPSFAGWQLAKRVARAIIARRADAWVDELAERHGVTRYSLEEYRSALG